MTTIGAYADMDISFKGGISEEHIKNFMAHLAKNGFYQAWKKGDKKISLPRQSVWKPYEAKENSKEEQLRVFALALDEITDLCMAFNKTLPDTNGVIKNEVVIENCIILSASPWAGLGIEEPQPEQKEQLKFEGWKDEETLKKYKAFETSFLANAQDGTPEIAKKIFKQTNGIS